MRLEAEIDLMNANLDPLGSFIMPGGSPARLRCTWRTVTRRAERHMTELAPRRWLVRMQCVI